MWACALGRVFFFVAALLVVTVRPSLGRKGPVLSKYLAHAGLHVSGGTSLPDLGAVQDDTSVRLGEAATVRSNTSATWPSATPDSKATRGRVVAAALPVSAATVALPLPVGALPLGDAPPDTNATRGGEAPAALLDSAAILALPLHDAIGPLGGQVPPVSTAATKNSLVASQLPVGAALPFGDARSEPNATNGGGDGRAVEPQAPLTVLLIPMMGFIMGVSCVCLVLIDTPLLRRDFRRRHPSQPLAAAPLGGPGSASSAAAGLWTPSFNAKTDFIFFACDRDRDGYVSYEELRWLARLTMPKDDKPLSREWFRDLCRPLGADARRGLNQQEFRQSYILLASDIDRDYAAVQIATLAQADASAVTEGAAAEAPTDASRASAALGAGRPAGALLERIMTPPALNGASSVEW